MKKGCGCFLIILIIIVASVLLVNNDNKNQQTKKSVEIKQTSLKNYEILDKTINYEYKDNVYGSKYKILVKTPLKKLDKNDIYNFVNNFRGEAKYKDYVIVYLYSTKKAYLEGKNDNYTKAYDYGFLGLYHSSNNNFKWMQAKGKFSDMMGESVSL